MTTPLKQQSDTSLDATTKKKSKFLFQLRDYFHNIVQINLNSIILIVSSILIFLLFFIGYRLFSTPLLYQLGGLISLDLIISVFFIHPIHSQKRQGNIKEQVTDWKHIIDTSGVSEEITKKYAIWLFPRVIIYYIGLLVYGSEILNPSFERSLIIFGMGLLFIYFIIIIFLVSFEGFAILTIVAIGDYYDQGKTYEAIQNVRTTLDGYTSEIDSLIAQIYDTNKLSIGNRSLSKNSRRKLANALLKIRSFSAISSSQSSNDLHTTISKYAQVEKELTAELYTKLQQEKCIICYGSLG